MSRSFLALLLTLSLFAILSSKPAVAAHGPALKGLLLSRSIVISGKTGQCTCNDVWYTMGLKPGTVKASVKLGQCSGAPKGAVCSTEVYLMRGNQQLADAIPSCFVTKKACNRVRSFTYHVAQQGVYYIYLRGAGAYSIDYTLNIQGPFYKLHCGTKYC